jgi:hypothetical protein
MSDSSSPALPHLLIPYAASGSPAAREALHHLPLPNLAQLLARLTATHLESDPDTDERPLAMPHERVLARALGLTAEPGHTPWAAHGLQQAGEQPGRQAWAWITPCQWLIGMDSVTLVNPVTLQLTETESRDLLAAMAPFFAEDGLVLHYETPGRWHAQGEVFRDLPTVSLDRVIGQNVKPWLPHALSSSRQARPLSKLQSEMQMLLYTHRVNDARAERRLPPVNAFWISGAGALDAVADSAPLPQQPAAAPVVPDGLRQAALRDDWAAWRQAWQQVDATHCAHLLATLEQTGRATLTLCSECNAQTFEAMPRTLSSRIKGLFGRQPLHHVLEAL